MREGWRQVRLGELFETTNNRLGEHTEEPEVFSVTKYEGFVPAAEYFGKRVASQKLDTYKVVAIDEWAYSTIHIDEGSIARNKLGKPGVVSPMYTTMRLIGEEVHPYYAEVLLRSPWMLAAYGDAQQGSINRRRSLPWKVFSGLVVPLPPLDEQQRIVDLVSAVDEATEAVEAQESAASASRGYLLSGLLARLDDKGELRALGELGTFVRGRRFTKNDYVEEGLGCVHYGQLYTHLGSVTTDPLTFVPDIMRSRLRLASRGDVIVAATSENIEDLGKATVWMGEGEVAVHDDCQIFRHTLDPRFAAHLFATKSFQEQKVQFAAGTKVTRISGDSLAKIVVPVPSPEHQATIGQAMSDFDGAIEALVRQRKSLQDVRAHLLTVLLSGEHEIPESYDELLEAS